MSLGGTITGEHGVGRLKRAWLPAYLGDDVMALTRRIKDALDPLGILNPGAILEPRDADLSDRAVAIATAASDRSEDQSRRS